jgi:hypothetical protein
MTAWIPASSAWSPVCAPCRIRNSSSADGHQAPIGVGPRCADAESTQNRVFGPFRCGCGAYRRLAQIEGRFQRSHSRDLGFLWSGRRGLEPATLTLAIWMGANYPPAPLLHSVTPRVRCYGDRNIRFLIIGRISFRTVRDALSEPQLRVVDLELGRGTPELLRRSTKFSQQLSVE